MKDERKRRKREHVKVRVKEQGEKWTGDLVNVLSVVNFVLS